MENLKSELLEVDSFENLTKKMMSKNTIVSAKGLLEDLKAEKLITPKVFLSSFLIYKYPEDSVGSQEIEINKKVIDLAKSIIECKKNKDLSKFLVKFNLNFKIWKEQDLKTIKEQLFNEYHQLTVDVIDTDDEDKKYIFETVKNEILNCAKNVGGLEFVQQIQSYTPILMNIEDLEKQYDKAYFDILCEEFDNKKYKRLENLLNFINETLRQLNSVTEINKINEVFDIDFIIQRFRHNAYSHDELESLCLFMYDLVKNIHSFAYDREIEAYKAELRGEDIYFPNVVMNIMKLIRNLVHDLENLRVKLENKMNENKE